MVIKDYRADFFDASALVKIHAQEPASEIVRSYFNSRALKYTSPFCFYETLNILKSKWLHRNELSRDEYLYAAFNLTAWYGVTSSKIEDLDFANPITFGNAQSLVERTGLDLSDAFQILSLKQGYFSGNINNSQTVLVTADKDLAVAARAEGLRVWYAMEESPPE
jgi:predicted nucleic acid-binding protein